MTRQTIRFPGGEELTEFICHGEKYPGYEWIDSNLENVDLWKGIETFDVIIQRKEDGKFFKMAYSRFSNGDDDDIESTIAVEVFPEEKTITIYK